MDMDSPKGRGRGNRGRPILGSGSASSGGTGDHSGSDSPQRGLGLSVNAPTFVPRGVPAGLQFYGQHQEGEVISAPVDDPIDVLRQTMHSMSVNPADYDEQMTILQEHLVSVVSDERTLVAAISEVVSQSIDDNNFHYLGARMCSALSHETRLRVESGTFRQHLLKRLRQEHEQSKEYSQTEVGRQRLAGFTLFMAELILTLKSETGEPLKVLVCAVEELLVILLTNPENSTVKAVAHVLKLVGFDLESTRRAGHPSKLDQIFRMIKDVIVDSNGVVKNMKLLLLSVVELRSSNWGRGVPAESSGASTDSGSTPAQAFCNEATFYGSAGQVISATEAGFLGPEDFDDCAGVNVENPVNGVYAEEPIMDDEANADFEQFLEHVQAQIGRNNTDKW